MEQFIFIGLLFIVGYIAGSIAEKNHYRSIVSREAQTLHMLLVSTKNVIMEDTDIVDAKMVQGSVVISIDYFKRILASLSNFFGGRVTVYESLVDRARREAILRMKEKAPKAQIVMNLRVETSTISGNVNARNSVGSIEAIAYGTAISFRNYSNNLKIQK
ncbi:MAG: heavy metal-binding domain-containing protein [Gammaproteobacteria bacterium]|nr:heavy metal-binding domain-containing protein [Gammaproteobacteria bacterium]